MTQSSSVAQTCGTGTRCLPPLPHTGVMGILNLTPDSFYAHSRVHAHVDRAVDRGIQLFEEGAHIIDMGGESTRPGSHPVNTQTELHRVIPVLTALYRQLPPPEKGGPLLCVDTRNPVVMDAAIHAGAHCINDIHALQAPGALPILQRHPHVYVCLMHKQGEPTTMQNHPTYTDSVCDVVMQFLQKRIQSCMEAGIARHRLFIDPGIGFGKTHVHNLQLIRHLAKLRRLRCRILLGVSRKSLIADVLGPCQPEDRLFGSIGASMVGLCHGAQWIRTHDVSATWQAMQMAEAIYNVQAKEYGAN